MADSVVDESSFLDDARRLSEEADNPCIGERQHGRRCRHKCVYANQMISEIERLRIAEGEAILVLESTEHKLAAVTAERDELREALQLNKIVELGRALEKVPHLTRRYGEMPVVTDYTGMFHSPETCGALGGRCAFAALLGGKEKGE